MRPVLQTFYNLNPDGDIFNHANVHFWDYTQPGYDALGLISCTGTNFLVRARAFQQARRHGWTGGVWCATVAAHRSAQLACEAYCCWGAVES